MAARGRLRRERLVAHRASGHADAEAWDLDFWQSQSPEDRLSALVAIRRDVEAVVAGRIAIEDLLAIKERIDHPRHQEDARVLRLVLERRRRRE